VVLVDLLRKAAAALVVAAFCASLKVMVAPIATGSSLARWN
jgi:hypothetical protein